MLLNLLCAGASIAFNNFEGIFQSAGNHSRISLVDSHWQSPSNLHGLMRTAGDKKLTVDAPGNFYSVPQLSSLIASAKGSGTELEVGKINNYSPQDIISIVKLLAGKTHALEVSCHAVNEANVGYLVGSLRGASGSINFDSASLLSPDLLAVVLSGVAGKVASFVLDSKLSSYERTIGAISQISASGFSSSLLDPQFIPPTQLSSAFSAAGGERLNVLLEQEFFPADVLKHLVSSAGSRTNIRSLELVFNGRQLTVDPVDGDKLQRVINASSRHTP